MHKIRILLYILCVILLFGSGIYLIQMQKAQIRIPSYIFPTVTPSTKPQMVASDSAELAVVLRVVDGDTIELSDGRKVRYIGVDTPELHHPTKGVQCFGQEAMEANKKLVEGKEIKMKKDVSNTDRYKRLLRYVWVPSTSSPLRSSSEGQAGQAIFVNEYLAREGYALQATFPPDVQYIELFGKAVEEARLKNKGLWDKCK